MNVEFYFDPSCPYSWVTSRWLIAVSNNRSEVTITWKPFGLAIKNGELRGDGSGEHLPAHRVLRIMAASVKAGADMGNLYTAFGTMKHVMGEDFSDDVLKKVLQAQKLPDDLLSAADDASYDADLAASTKSAIDLVGYDIGVPTIIFNGKGGRSGYFGPVLLRMPSVRESLKLWDSLCVLATFPDFYELKRGRGGREPDTASTAICLP